MTVRETATSTTTDVPVVTTTETVVLTTPAVSTTGVDDKVSIIGLVNMTFGTGATAVTVRVRRGTTATGTLVGPQDAVLATAGSTWELNFAVTDTPGEVAGQQYVVTVQQTAATANGTALASEASVTLGVN